MNRMPFSLGRVSLVLAMLGWLCPACANPAGAATPRPDSSTVKEGENTLFASDDALQYLSSGFSAPVSLVNADADDVGEPLPVANADISYQNGEFIFGGLVLLPDSDVVLSAESLALLESHKGQALDASHELRLGEHMIFSLNQDTMLASLRVDASALGLHRKEARELGAASSDGLNSVLNYRFSGYASQYQEQSSQSGTLSFESITSLGENHLEVEGYVSQGSDNAGNALDMQKVMVERDFGGYRFAAGMLDSWGIQSLGNVSTAYGERFYGASFGNAASSAARNAGQSLIPIVVYLPSAGEVRIKRDGRLLAVMRLALGNHELDTSRLPVGVYEVEVEVVVAGQVVSTRSYRVNKPYNGGKYGPGLSWQLWGGVSESENGYALTELERSTRRTPLFGVSLASQLWDAEWNASLYRNDRTSVAETYLSWQASDFLRLDWQGLFADDGSRRHAMGVALDLPAGLGSLWLNSERGRDGERLQYVGSNYDMAGLSFNLSQWLENAGTLSVSYQKNRDDDSRTLQTSYSHSFNLQSGGAVTLELGANQNSGAGVATERQYYGMLTFSLSMDSYFSVGLSQQNGQRTLDLSANRSFDDGGVLTGLNANVSLAQSESSSQVDVGYGLEGSYAGRYGSGVAALSGARDSRSLSLSHAGSLSLAAGGVSAGGDTGQSGFVIEMPDVGASELEARIDGRSYPLGSGRNFIALPAYKDYTVQVLAHDEAGSAYQIEHITKRFTLYPGNVIELKPGIKRMVTVFGRLKNAAGEPLKGARIKNHIGETVSDDKGNFSIDVDSRYPEMKVQSTDAGAFEMVLELPDRSGTAWLGDVVWRTNGDGKLLVKPKEL